MKTTAALALILAVSLASCSSRSKQSIGDGGLVSGESCNAPCLWRITPGVTRENVARAILYSRGLSQTCEDMHSTFDPTPGILCGFPDIVFHGYPATLLLSIDERTRIVTSLYFSPSPPIELQAVIKKQGQPSAVEVGHEGPPGLEAVDSRVYYASISTILILRYRLASVAEIEPGTPIEMVYYLSPQGYKDYVRGTIELFRTGNGELLPWRGYGTYP